ncbi:unnamed protein product [Ixodes persulcatus]
MLFNIYVNGPINNLVNIDDNVNCINYADDTSIFFPVLT